MLNYLSSNYLGHQKIYTTGGQKLLNQRIRDFYIFLPFVYIYVFRKTSSTWQMFSNDKILTVGFLKNLLCAIF